MNGAVLSQLPRVAADFLGRTLGPLLGTRQQRVVVPGAAAEQQASAQHQQQQQQLQQRRRGARAEPNGRPPQVKLSHAATVPVLRRVLRRIAPDAVQELAAGIATIMEVQKGPAFSSAVQFTSPTDSYKI